MENQNISTIKIVNKELQFKKVSLIEPSVHSYLHIAAEIDKSFFPFFLTTSKKKKELIQKCKQWCHQLEAEKLALSAVVFIARLIPPGKGKFLKERKGKVHIANYDFAILIETTSPDALRAIQETTIYQEMESAIKKVSTFTHITEASNIKRINPVDHSRQGVFLFNHFFADDLNQNLGVWEYTAGWFQQETGLDNSTVLLPVTESDSHYSIINHCRWDKMSDILPSLIFKKSFHSYVLDNFYANNVAAMPVLYKMA